jgi:hypothetical protein
MNHGWHGFHGWEYVANEVFTEGRKDREGERQKGLNRRFRRERRGDSCKGDETNHT